MSLQESGESDGGVSLGALPDGGARTAADPGSTLGDALELARRRGWPRRRDANSDAAGDAASAYLDEEAEGRPSECGGVVRGSGDIEMTPA